MTSKEKRRRRNAALAKLDEGLVALECLEMAAALDTQSFRVLAARIVQLQADAAQPAPGDTPAQS